MKIISLILIGGGYSSIEIIDLIEDINNIEKKQFIKIIGILDDQKKINTSINGIKIIGKLKDIKKFKNEKFFVNIFDRNNRFIRPKLIKKLNISLFRFFSIIHPHNLLGKKAKIGFGVSIYPGCTIFSNSKIGNFCNVMPNVSVASNTVIEDNCFIGKDVFVGSQSRIKRNVYISNGTTILENTFINQGNRIIPHSMINRSIEKKEMIVGGTPAKILFKENIIKFRKNASKLKLRLAKNDDLHFLFKLYNKNVLEKKFFSLKQVNFKEHKLWFKNKIKENMIFIGVLGEDEIGYVRFDKVDNLSISVSIAIKKKYQRKGYGRNILNKALSKRKISKFKVLAYIVRKNLTSKRFFLSLGFKFIKNNQFLKKATK